MQNGVPDMRAVQDAGMQAGAQAADKQAEEVQAAGMREEVQAADKQAEGVRAADMQGVQEVQVAGTQEPVLP